MKTAISLLLLASGMAHAQSQESLRRLDRGARVEGTYQSSERNGTIRRVLRLSRDGQADILTEIRREARGTDRRDWTKDDTRRFGRVADEASLARPLRHTGNWTLRDGNVVVRLADLNPDSRIRPRIDLVLFPRDGTLVLDRNNDLYGIEKITFRPDAGTGAGRPGPTSRLGSVRYDGVELDIDSAQVISGRADTRLVILAGARRIVLRGELRSRGGEQKFVLDYNERQGEGGELTLRMRGMVVVSIRGNGVQDRRRIDFRGNGGRRD